MPSRIIVSQGAWRKERHLTLNSAPLRNSYATCAAILSFSDTNDTIISLLQRTAAMRLVDLGQSPVGAAQ
jgi:hypothetical protein